jgi:hypothetical protein
MGPRLHPRLRAPAGPRAASLWLSCETRSVTHLSPRNSNVGWLRWHGWLGWLGCGHIFSIWYPWIPTDLLHIFSQILLHFESHRYLLAERIFCGSKKSGKTRKPWVFRCSIWGEGIIMYYPLRRNFGTAEPAWPANSDSNLGSTVSTKASSQVTVTSSLN